MNEIVIGSPNELSPFYSIYLWGLELIRGIRTIESPEFTAVMKFVTSLGSEYFYIPVILLVFWCLDVEKGFRLGALILFSAWANGFFKNLLKQPRPYDLDPSVGLAFAFGYGLPSGHAQMSLVFWAVALGFWLRKRPAWAGTVLITLLIGFTRLYLGLHFPTDLLGGWFLGGVILTLYFLLEGRIETILAAGGPRLQMISAALTALAMNALYPQDKSLGALFLGFAVGYSLAGKYGLFLARPETKGKKNALPVLTLRYALGLAGAVFIYFGLRLILSGVFSFFEEASYGELSRFLRYGLLGLWVSAGASWVFPRIGLGRTGTDLKNE
jgi:membrane-associated phospholipid phosphatase